MILNCQMQVIKSNERVSSKQRCGLAAFLRWCSQEECSYVGIHVIILYSSNTHIPNKLVHSRLPGNTDHLSCLCKAFCVYMYLARNGGSQVLHEVYRGS